MNRPWSDSLLPLSRGGTHPAADAAPLPRGDRKNSPPRRSDAYCFVGPRWGGFLFTSSTPGEREQSLEENAHAYQPPMGARIPSPRSLTLPLMLAVVMTSVGCSVVPLSLYQTLPSTRLALSSIEGAQRSLDDTSADYEDSLEAAPAERPVAAYGATHGAYQRWVTDEVRELPDVSQTIAIGGGDT